MISAVTLSLRKGLDYAPAEPKRRVQSCSYMSELGGRTKTSTNQLALASVLRSLPASVQPALRNYRRTGLKRVITGKNLKKRDDNVMVPGIWEVLDLMHLPAAGPAKYQGTMSPPGNAFILAELYRARHWRIRPGTIVTFA